MSRRLAPLLLLALCGSLLAAPGPASAGTAPDHRPDEWIKLCGLSTGCTIHGLPNPWKGDDVYNRTGRRQRIHVRMEDGEGVRFWIALQNDGALADTIVVQGCKGNRHFRVNRVVLGKVKRPDAGATKFTKKFKRGTAQFDLPPSSRNKKVFFTLNILAPTTAEGVSYKCPITIHSKADPSLEDTVLAKMTTY